MCQTTDNTVNTLLPGRRRRVKPVVRETQPLTEAEMLEQLKRIALLPGLNIRVVALEERREEGVVDASIDVIWRDRPFPFDAELKARSTPAAFNAAVEQARRAAVRSGRYLARGVARLKKRSASATLSCGKRAIQPCSSIRVPRMACPMHPRCRRIWSSRVATSVSDRPPNRSASKSWARSPRDNLKEFGRADRSAESHAARSG